MAEAVRLRTNWPKVSRELRSWARDQVPFATAKALTATAIGARDLQRRLMRRRFQIRSQRVPKGIQSTTARKQDHPRPRASVGTLDAFIGRFEEGGIQRPRGRHRWAVPSPRVRRTSTGRTIARHRPRKLLDGRAFKRTGRILAPLGRGRSARLGAFYWLRRSIRLQPRLGLERTVTAYARRHFDRHLIRELEAATRTRRPRR